MKKIVLVIFLLAMPLDAQTTALNGYCDLGATKALTSGLNSSNSFQGLVPSCTVTVYIDSVYSVKNSSYTSGGTATGTTGETCTVTFLGGTTNAVGTVTLTGTNTIGSGAAITISSGGDYTTAPTTATLSSGTATCSGTAAVSATMTPALATLYADSSNTVLSNPFTANTDASWLFYAADNQGYDISMSGGISPYVYPSPVTITDLYLAGPGFSGALSGDVTGTQSATTVVRLENIALPTLASATGLLYDTDGVLSLPSTLPTAAEPAHTGDVTNTAGSLALTLATVNTDVGSFGSSTAIPSITVNGKGLITAISTDVVIAPAGTLSGTTLNSTVVNSSLTSVGTLTSLAVSGATTLSGALILSAIGPSTNPLCTTTAGTVTNSGCITPGGTDYYFSFTGCTLTVGGNSVNCQGTQLFSGVSPVVATQADADYYIGCTTYTTEGWGSSTGVNNVTTTGFDFVENVDRYNSVSATVTPTVWCHLHHN
jgi:hypothetical protein